MLLKPAKGLTGVLSALVEYEFPPTSRFWTRLDARQKLCNTRLPIGRGSKHDSTKLPLLLVSGLDGTLQTGSVINYLDRPDDERKLCSSYLSIMDRMGVRLDRFADAEKPLAGI